MSAARTHIGALTLFSALAVCACGVTTAEIRAAVERARDGVEDAKSTAALAMERAVLDEAIVGAQRLVGQYVATFDLSSPAAVRAHCQIDLDNGDAQGALSCVNTFAEAGVETAGLFLVAADAHTSLAAYPEARRSLFAARDLEPEYPGLQDRLESAFADDPRFNRAVDTIVDDVPVERIRSLGGGSTITMRFLVNDEEVAAFKPNQTREQSNYRAEVAAYRFCEVIRCGFEVPYSYEVRIRESDFMRLYGIRSLEGNEGYASNFVDLRWTLVEGESTRYLHGVWKDWVPGFTQFPIEYDQVWRPWLDVEADPALLNQPLEEALDELSDLEDGNYRNVMERQGDLETAGLAQQISNMLAFDFLINNWDRFSGTYFGVNCQFANGHFVSIDNGAGFTWADPERPRSHLHQVTRFSASLVREVQLLDREAMLPLLFPNPTASEERMFDAFWTRREEFLTYVDGLIGEYGEDAVLFFE